MWSIAARLVHLRKMPLVPSRLSLGAALRCARVDSGPFIRRRRRSPDLGASFSESVDAGALDAHRRRVADRAHQAVLAVDLGERVGHDEVRRIAQADLGEALETINFQLGVQRRSTRRTAPAVNDRCEAHERQRDAPDRACGGAAHRRREVDALAQKYGDGARINVVQRIGRPVEAIERLERLERLDQQDGAGGAGGARTSSARRRGWRRSTRRTRPTRPTPPPSVATSSRSS